MHNDLHKTWPHRWVTQKAKQSPSKISGSGFIAIDDIKENEVIIVYGGVILPKKDLSKYRSIMGNYDYPIDENYSIAPTTHEELKTTGSINHSCEPNVGWNGVLTIAAMRDISKGEELATDYAFMGGTQSLLNVDAKPLAVEKLFVPLTGRTKPSVKNMGIGLSLFLERNFNLLVMLAVGVAFAMVQPN